MTQQTESFDDQIDDPGSYSARSEVIVFHPVVDSVVVRNFWRVLIGGLFGLFICVEFYQQVLGVLPAPSIALWLAVAAGIALGLLLPRRRVWRIVELRSDGLTLTDLHGDSESVPSKQIRLITGEMGLSLHGGEMLCWKWVRVILPNQQFKLRMEQQSESLYVALLQCCPSSAGISYTGEIHLPILTSSSNLAAEQQASLVETEFRSQTRRTWIGAASALIASVIAVPLLILAWMKAPKENHDDLAKLSMWVCVLIAIALLLLVFALKKQFAARRVTSRLRSAPPLFRQAHIPHHLTMPPYDIVPASIPGK